MDVYSQNPTGQAIMEKWVEGSVGPGWYPLIGKLIDELLCAGWDGQITQIKEKFGSLRAYIGYGSDEIYHIIDKYHALSVHTCEDCGKPGRNKTSPGGYWLHTLCASCRRKETIKRKRWMNERANRCC